MRRLLSIFAMLMTMAACAHAQAITGATIQTTSTASGSVKVGCAIGSSVCTGGIIAGPIDVASVTSSGFIGIANNVPGVTTNRLYNNGGTLTWAGSPVAIGGAVGPGTIGKLTKFTGANAVGDSIITESGTTVTVASTLNATSLGGTLTTASQTAITGVGTLTAGTWTATAIGVTYGGTGSNLSGTGGTSQFLRQNSLGAAITPVRPAISDLSDASNVALLNASNTFTAGPQIINTTVANAFFQIKESGVNRAYIGLSGAIKGTSANDLAFFAEVGKGMTWMVNGSATDAMTLSTAGLLTVLGGIKGTNDLDISSANANGNISLLATGTGRVRLYSAGAERWSVNTAGDWTFGASTHIADSNGTPIGNTDSTGNIWFAATGGTDYAFIASSTGINGSGNVVFTFGHTYNAAPSCNATSGAAATTAVWAVSTTTTITLNWTGTGAAANKIHVQCRGY